MKKLIVTPSLMADLYDHTILLKRNSPAPSSTSFGWLRVGEELAVTGASLLIESFSGLYGGKYAPFVGGRKYSGLCALGAFSYSYSALPEGLRVGRYCSISSGLRFLDSSHPGAIITTSAFTFRPTNKLFAPFVTPQVKDFAAEFDIHGGKPFPVLGHDVWIGANVTLAMGIQIGNGAIVASGSVVTHDVPAYAMVAGNPAVIKKMRFSDEVTAALQASAWWALDPLWVFSQNFRDPQGFCEQLAAHGAQVPRFNPPALEITRHLADEGEQAYESADQGQALHAS
jgi:virginiamycin A acetyltransferase